MVVKTPLTRSDRLGIFTVPGTDLSHSIVGGSHHYQRSCAGLIVENYERENAFGEAEIRLLTTVAASMGVALENARLFDETQRLFKESEQRAAELAIINSVQQALAAELNMQGIYDAVGDKIREIFHHSDLGIRIYDPQTKLIHYPYVYEKGDGSHQIGCPWRKGLCRPCLAHARDTRHQREHDGDRENRQLCPARNTDGKIRSYVPLVAGDQARGLIKLSGHGT